MPWIRLDTSTTTDEFTVELTGDEYKAWCFVLLHVKAQGSRGMAPASSAKVFGRAWNVPASAIESMFKKAGDRFTREDGQICVKNWHKYQEDWREGGHRPKPKGRNGRESSAQTADANKGNRGAYTTAQHSTYTAQKEKKDARAQESAKPESIEEVRALFATKGSTSCEADKFYAYYDSNGWRVGKNPMKKWRSAAIGWISRATEFTRRQPTGKEDRTVDAFLERQRKREPITASPEVAAVLGKLAGMKAMP